MIRHVVMWKLAGETPEEKLAHARVYKTELEALRGRIPGMSSISVGFDLGNAGNSCDVVLISEHDDRAALDVYQDHPLHVAVKEQLKGRSVERRVVDCEA